MRNKYLKDFIYDKEKRLKLLKYTDQDITEISPVLGEITLNLMEQCYNHTEVFHEYNKKKNKRYYKIQRLINNQLKNLLFIQKEFANDFLKLSTKTKEDLYEYVYAYQMHEHFYDQYIYRVLVESLKDEFSKEFWDKNELDKHVTGMINADNYTICSNTKEEISTGRVNFNFDKPIEIINKNINNIDNEQRIKMKLNLIKEIGNVIENYPCQEFLMIHMPYKDSINDLVDNIKVSLDYEKPRQYKRRNKYKR